MSVNSWKLNTKLSQKLLQQSISRTQSYKQFCNEQELITNFIFVHVASDKGLSENSHNDINLPIINSKFLLLKNGHNIG